MGVAIHRGHSPHGPSSETRPHFAAHAQLPCRQRRLCVDLCVRSHMATNLSLDPKLIERALEVSGERTKKAAVTRALEEFIARRRQKRLVDLMGKLEWDQSFDHKAERSRR